jgi:hypothetical protein
MAELMGTRPFILRDTPAHNSHPIPANLQIIAYDRIKQYRTKFTDHRGVVMPAIDIGGNGLRTDKNDHICTLIKSSREEARYLRANILKPHKETALIGTELQHLACVHGAENCSFKASYAYMINVYDVTFEQIVTIFNKHDLRVLDVWMFMPHCLLEPGLTADQTYYKCQLTQESYKEQMMRYLDGKNNDTARTDKVLFHFGDQSNAYYHDLYSWKKWFYTTKIEAIGFDIEIEIIETFGTFTNFRLTKTSNYPGFIYRIIPTSSQYKNFMIVPDILQFIEDSAWRAANSRITDEFVRKWFNFGPHEQNWVKNRNVINTTIYPSCIIVDEHIVKSTLFYMERLKKEVFSYEQCCAYFTTQLNSIMYDRNSYMITVHKCTQIPINIAIRLKISLYVIAAIERNKRTQVIAEAFNKFKRNKLTKFFEKLKTKIKNLSTPSGISSVLTEDQNYDGTFEDLKPIYFKDHIVNQVHKSKQVVDKTNLSLPNLNRTVWRYDNDDYIAYNLIDPDSEDLIKLDEQIDETDLMKNVMSDGWGNYIPIEEKEVVPSAPKIDDAIELPSAPVAPNNLVEVRPGIFDAVDLQQNRQRYNDVAKPVVKPVIEVFDNTKEPKTENIITKEKIINKITVNKDQTGKDNNVLVGIDGLKRKYQHILFKKDVDYKIIDVDTNGKCLDESISFYALNKNLNAEIGVILDLNHGISTLLDLDFNVIIFVFENKTSTNIRVDQIYRNGSNQNAYFLINDNHIQPVDLNKFEINNVYNPTFNKLVYGRDLIGDILNHDYAQIDNQIICENIVTFNCANEYLSDGAGQAKSFAARYNGYAKQHKILTPIMPVHIVKNLETWKNTNVSVHAALVVAEYFKGNKSKEDYIKSHKRYDYIIDELNQNFKKWDLLVIPMIGTQLFGNDIECFKQALNKLKVRYVITTYDESAATLMNHFNRCVHLGYKNVDVVGKIDKVAMESKYYKYIVKTFGKVNNYNKCIDMLKLYNDIINGTFSQNSPRVKMLIDNIILKKFKHHHKNKHLEISGAPGYFNSLKQVDCYYYISGIPWNEKLGKAKASYNNNDELINLLKKNHTKYDLIISDINSDDNTYDDIIKVRNLVLELKHVFLCKIVVQFNNDKFKDFYNKLIDGHLCFISRSDYTNAHSSECYLFIFPIQHLSVVHNLNEYIEKIDEGCVLKQESRCKCTPLIFNNNALLTVTFAEIDLNIVKIEMTNSKFYEDNKDLIDNLEIKDVKSTTYKIPAILGVGGSGKTSELCKQTCSSCTLLISPYKEQTNNINANFSNLANTFQVALINLLRMKDKKFKKKNIIIDEVFAQNPAYLAMILSILDKNQNIFATGDPNQYIPRNFNGHGVKIEFDYLQDPSIGYYLTETKRNPKSVVDLINKIVDIGRKITTKSDVKNKVLYKPVDDLYKLDKDPKCFSEAIITMTSNGVALLKNKIISKIPILSMASAHGSTIEKVHLYLSDITTVPSDLRGTYFYTAASRTSRQLIIYGANSEQELIMTLNGSPLERALEEFQIPVMAETRPANIEVEYNKIDPVEVIPPEVPTEVVAHILDEVYVKESDNDILINTVTPNVLPENKTKAKFKVNYEAMTTANITEIKEGERKIWPFKNYQQIYESKNKMKSVSTLLGRYANKVRESPIPKSTIKDFIKGVEVWLKPNYKEIANKHQPRPEDIMTKMIDGLRILQKKFPQEFAEYVDDQSLMLLLLDNPMNRLEHYEKIIKDHEDGIIITDDEVDDIKTKIEFLKKYVTYHKKIIISNIDENVVTLKNYKMDPKDENTFKEIYERKIKIKGIVRKFIESLSQSDNSFFNIYKDMEKEFTEEYNNYHNMVSFHMKKQPKEIRKTGFDSTNKYGQGVSAWSKMVNMVLSGYVRYFSDVWLLMLKPNVQLAQGASDSVISMFFSKYSKEINDRRLKKVACDFSEFDTTQEFNGVYTCATFQAMGWFNPKAVGLMMKQRSAWTMKLMVGNEEVTSYAFLNGEWQQHSGQVATLESNGFYNMAALGLVMKITDLKFASFKGDDSLICCAGWEWRKSLDYDNARFIDICQYRLKMEQNEIVEYIANIITPFGFVPDYLRRASRIFSKILHNKDDWDEMRRSIKDCLDVLSHNNLRAAFEYASVFYKQYGIYITSQQIESIHWFLRHIAEGNRNYIETVEHSVYVNLADLNEHSVIYKN